LDADDCPFSGLVDAVHMDAGRETPQQGVSTLPPEHPPVGESSVHLERDIKDVSDMLFAVLGARGRPSLKDSSFILKDGTTVKFNFEPPADEEASSAELRAKLARIRSESE